MRAPRISIFTAAAAGLLALTIQPVFASNGMNMIGFGAESVAMGGADLAFTTGPCAMNINPANIGRLRRPEFEFGLSPMMPSLSHSDEFGNDRDDDLQRYPVPFVGYAHPVGRQVTVGVGFFIQGGMGARFRDLSTPFSSMANSGRVPAAFFTGDTIPDTDDTLTSIRHARLTPTVAWQVHPKLTLGTSLNLSYVKAEMKLFPETSVMADMDRSGIPGDSRRDAFFGMHLQDASSLGYGGRVGFLYTDGPLSFAGAYTTKTSLDLDDGRMTMNLSAIGLGDVDYEAELADFAWPQQAGLGLAYRVHPRVVIAGDLDWINWSDAIETVTIRMRNPDDPRAPSSREMPFRMDWEDQWVYAVGMEITPAPNWAARLGFNHGDSPIPSDRLRPLFPAIAEDHITAGFGVRRDRWTLDLGFEYVLKTEMTNNSTDPTVNLFGPGARASLSQFVAHLLLRRSWSP